MDGIDFFGWAQDQRNRPPSTVASHSPLLADRDGLVRSVCGQLAGLVQHCHDHGITNLRLLDNLLWVPLPGMIPHQQGTAAGAVKMIGWGVSTDSSASNARATHRVSRGTGAFTYTP